MGEVTNSSATADMKTQTETETLAGSSLKRLVRSTDNMAYELCKITAGHPMNCQCSADKSLRLYKETKSALAQTIVAGEQLPSDRGCLSSVWKWLIYRTTRRCASAPNDQALPQGGAKETHE